jgi:hypothetical protein
MKPEMLCVDFDDAELAPTTSDLRPEFQPGEPELGLWMRTCPFCQVILCKSSPNVVLYCACGWEWKA